MLIGTTKLNLKHGWEISTMNDFKITETSFFTDNGFLQRIIISSLQKLTERTGFIKQEGNYYHIFVAKHWSGKISDFTYFKIKKDVLLATFVSEEDYSEARNLISGAEAKYRDEFRKLNRQLTVLADDHGKEITKIWTGFGVSLEK